MTEVRVKICGLTRPDDAAVAVEAGADLLGVVLVPSSPRASTPEDAARIRGDLDAELVLVTADRPVEELAAFARTAGADVLQLHGSEGPETLRRLRDRGDWILWKAVRIRSRDDAERALDCYAGVADGLLWDGWDPDRLGGAGSLFPWDEVASVRRAFPDGLTLIAAGGLTPTNVADAVRRLAPDVVDVSSGVEAAPGRKEPARIRAFIRSVRELRTTDAGS